MGHSLIVGQTESGKSTLAKRLANAYKAKNIKVVVLDDMLDPGYNADFITDDPGEFFDFVTNPQRCLRCALFADDIGNKIGRYNSQAEWLVTKARHFGHVSHIITQMPQQYSPTIRGQCQLAYVFGGLEDTVIKYIRGGWPRGNFDDVYTLQRGEFIRYAKWDGQLRGRVF